VRNGVAFYRVALPAIPAKAAGSHGGTWHAVLTLGRRYGHGFTHAAVAGAQSVLVPYDFLAHAYSNLVFRASSVQATFAPGATVQVFGTLKEYDVPVAGSRAAVWAEVRRPDNSTFNLAMPGAESAPRSGSFNTSLPGVYTIRVRAQGETLYGSPFTREQMVTAVAVPGGGTTPAEPPRDPLVELLCCLFKGGQLPDPMRRRLDALGIDSEHLMRCLRHVCARHPAAERERRGAGQPATGHIAEVNLELVRHLRAVLDRFGGDE
jgi:hypothetical protein